MKRSGPLLGHSDVPLSSAYDLAMLDLDGVVYVGSHAVPGAPEELARVREAGMRCAFITNNASRSPRTVAEHLRELGVAVDDADVVTSAQAAARLLADRLPAGAAVAVLGAEALVDEVRLAGLEPVGVDAPDAQALVSGYGPEVLWREVMRAAVRVRAGLWWVASNTDGSIPTSYGVAPGHGVLVETVSRFAGVWPVVAGKPARPLLDETVRRVGGEHPLMVGDRLDTDIAGAATAGIDSLLVLTGVTGLAELVGARPEERPTYVARDLRGLLTAHDRPEQSAAETRSGGWRLTVSQGRVEVSGEGSVDDWWRGVASAAWAYLDTTGETVRTDGLMVPAEIAAGDR
ncbi:MAG: HAD-IIA family hydrolase [Actinomycetota bacterium]|nr:HAD-IIA family hydrolase [Actinomycetota bacterium]